MKEKHHSPNGFDRKPGELESLRSNYGIKMSGLFKSDAWFPRKSRINIVLKIYLSAYDWLPLVK